MAAPEVMNASTWYYYHAERLRYWRRPNGSSTCCKPLTPRLLEELERLHDEREAREVATAAHHCKTTLAEAAARLNRAVSTLSHESVPHERTMLLPAMVAAAAQRLTSMMSGMRRLVSKTSRTPS